MSARPFVVLVAAVTGALFLACSPAAVAVPYGPWGAPQFVGGDGESLQAFDVNERGEAGVVTNSVERTGPRYQPIYIDTMRVAFAAPGGGFGPLQTVFHGPRPPGSYGASLTMSDSGEAVLQTGNGFMIRRPDGGFGEPQAIAGVAGQASVAMDRAGNALALFLTGCDTAAGERRNEIRVAFKPAGGMHFGPPRSLGCARDIGGNPVVVFKSPGVPMILFEAFDPGTGNRAQRVYAVVGDMSGNFTPPAMLSAPGDDTKGYGRPLTLTSNGRGDALAGWVSNHTGTSYALFRANGSVGRMTDGGGNFALGAVDRDGDALAIPSTLDGHARIALAEKTSTVFRRLDLPDVYTPESLGFDAYGTVQMAGTLPENPGRYVTWSVLPDGTFGDADYVIPVGFPRIKYGFGVKFDGRGSGWAAWTSYPKNGPFRVVVAPYDGRYSAALQGPRISAVGVRRAKRKAVAATAVKRRAPRVVALRLTLSKSARVSADIVPGKIRLKRTLVPGRVEIAIPKRVGRRLRHGARYRLTVRARDKRGRLSKPRSVKFRG